MTLTADASSVLTSMALQTTLRYALNLISCAQVLARKRRAEQVDVEDLRRAYSYFMDEKRSVQWLKEQQGFLVFEEVDALEEVVQGEKAKEKGAKAGGKDVDVDVGDVGDKEDAVMDAL